MSAATVAAVATVASVGVGAASAAGAFAPGAPSQVNFGQTVAQDQAAQIANLPSALQASQQYDPQFAAVQQQINYNNLFGTPGGSTTTNVSMPTQGFINGKTGQFVAGSVNPGINGQGANGSVADWQPFTKITNNPQTVTTPATPGDLAIAQAALPAIDELAANANTAQRTATIGDVNTLGPAALAALQNFDPAQTQLENTLTWQAQSELAAGSNLTPSQQEQDTQYVRAGQAARGLGVGPSDVYTEAFTLGQAGQNQLQQRQAFAGNVVNQQSQLYGDPFLAITGQSSGRNVSPDQFNTGGNTSTQSALSPNAGLSVATSNNALTNQANIAGFNSQTQGIGSLVGQSGNFGTLFNQVLQGFGSGTAPLTNTTAPVGTVGSQFDPSEEFQG